MIFPKLIIFIVIFILPLSDVSCFDQNSLKEDCLNNVAIASGLTDLSCLTGKFVKIQRVKSNSEVFYCIRYEKTTGNKNDYNSLAIKFRNEFFDMDFTGVSVISDEIKNPIFKLHDVRSNAVYKGRFAISSNNPAFDIESIKINDELQTCSESRKQIWPVIERQNAIPVDRPPVSASPTMRTKVKTTPTPPTTTVKNSNPSCGIVRKIEKFGNYVPSSFTTPGNYPWVVAIYRSYNDDEKSYYKCGGTIVNQNTILTSVNCLLEDGLLLSPEDLLIEVSPFLLSAERVRTKMYKVGKVVPHEDYNYRLRNNIAVVKLGKDLEFGDYVQPACLPDETIALENLIGKLAGFGKSTSRLPPNSEVLTEAEFQIIESAKSTLTGDNTSGNSGFSDMGAGLYLNQTNQWFLVGIASQQVKIGTTGTEFMSVKDYVQWMTEFL